MKRLFRPKASGNVTLTRDKCGLFILKTNKVTVLRFNQYEAALIQYRSQVRREAGSRRNGCYTPYWFYSYGSPAAYTGNTMGSDNRACPRSTSLYTNASWN